MKTVLCFGDSITWGFDPADGSRFPFEKRWPGILQHSLGDDFRIIEEALAGRTAATDSSLVPHRNGRALLEPLLESHAPLDWVVIMLGTNDVAPSYRLSAADIAVGCATLVWAVQKSQAGPGGATPEILLIAPPSLREFSDFMGLFYKGGRSKSKQLPAAYAKVAKACACRFLDASTLVQASKLDGVHLDAAEQRTLALAIKALIETPSLQTGS